MKNFLLLTVITGFVFASLKSSGQICFNPISTYDVTVANATTMCSTDFNGDGKVDFATANSDGISILLQDVLGGYSSSVSVGSVTYSSSICTADFNNDGIADLISFNYGPGEISIFEGTGTGSFTFVTSISTGIFSVSASLCAADFNNDGDMDFALSSGFNFVIVALGAGNETFGMLINMPTSAAILGSMIAADFNNDGNIDLATLSVVILGDGLGGFNSTVNYSGTGYFLSIVSDDFNEDGNLDIAAANYGTGVTGDVALFLGDGMGSFTAAGNFGIGDSTVPPNSSTAGFLICSGNFNGDTHIDLALGTLKSGINYTSAATILEGDGTGNFGLPLSIAIPNLAHAIIATDIDGSGKIDLAVLTRDFADTSKLNILLNCDVTGIAHVDSKNSFFELYPNPGQGIFVINAENTIDEITITDLLGKVVFVSAPFQRSISLSLKEAGMYFVRIQMLGQMLSRKLIVND